MVKSYYKWLFEDSTKAWPKFQNFIMDDRDFPRKTKSYDAIRDYLELIVAPNTVLDEFEESFDAYNEYLDEWENE